MVSLEVNNYMEVEVATAGLRECQEPDATFGSRSSSRSLKQAPRPVRLMSRAPRAESSVAP